jgi:hypothetical protein
MTTFADHRRTVLLRSLLDTGKFAEEVVYLPAAGGRQTVRALIQPAKASLQERQMGSATVEEIDVRVSLDPEATVDGVAVGGVREPKYGDGLIRAGDSDERAFSFSFVMERVSHSWLLRFERETPEQWGRQTRG